jgi:hypothetical protein
VTIPVTFTYTPAVDMNGNPTYLGANIEPVYTLLITNIPPH